MKVKQIIMIIIVCISVLLSVGLSASYSLDLTALEGEWFSLNIKLSGCKFPADDPETKPAKFSSKIKAYLKIESVILQSSIILGKVYVRDTFGDWWTPGDFEMDVIGGTESDFVIEGYGTWTDSHGYETIDFEPDLRFSITMNQMGIKKTS